MLCCFGVGHKHVFDIEHVSNIEPLLYSDKYNDSSTEGPNVISMVKTSGSESI